MEALLQSCQRELERLQAVNEIQKIMGRYEVVHNPLTMWRTPIDCFALTMPDVSMEVSDWGVWVGAEAVQYLFGTVMKEEPVGTMFMWPWAYPRKAEQMQVHSTAGASAHTQNTAFSLPMI